MPGLLDRLGSGEKLVADGAMGTMLFERGLAPGECPEWFNLEKPEVLSEIAALYLDAGSDIVSTNTFGGSPLKLAAYSLDDKTEEINRAAIRAAKDAVGGRALVAASVGPCGKLLVPYGDTDPAAVAESFDRQIQAILEEGVDAIFIETMTDLSEAVLAVRSAKKLAAEVPVSATMTFDLTPRGIYTIMGNSIEQACAELQAAGADIVGSNCGNGVENMIRIAAEFTRYSRLPLLIQSNAGLPQLQEGQLLYPETPQYMADKSRDLLELGVQIIGGCCGTTPEHIRAIRKLVNQVEPAG